MRLFEAFSYNVYKASHKYNETGEAEKPKKKRIKEAISVILIGVEDPFIDY